MRYLFVIFLTILFLAACSQDTPEEESDFKKNVEVVNAYLAPSKFKPEMIVVSAKGQILIGCISKEKFSELLSHARNKEKTKFNGMINGVDCLAIPEDQKYKIVSVDHHIVEFVKNTSDSANGLWTAEEAFDVLQK